MARNTRNYSRDRDTQENFNYDEKYSETGESEFSRDSTVPFDQDEVLSERHYTFAPLEMHGRKRFRTREPRTEPSYQRSYRGLGPKNYSRSDDKIKDDVSETLYRSTAVDASDIEVFVDEGTVTLRGTVNSRDQKKMAEYSIEHLAGVKDVYNELRVRKEDLNNRNPEESRFGLTNNITGMN